MSNPNGRQQKAIGRTDQRFEKFDQRLDRQDATLRMIWTQCGGKADQRLPIDD